jgi:hypothetical protein
VCQLFGTLTIGIHPAELADHDDHFADVEVLHVHVDKRADAIHRADQENLEENLQKKRISNE